MNVTDLNRALALAHEEALEDVMPDLLGKYDTLFTHVADSAAAKFKRRSKPVTAAADWAPPAPDELVDDNEIEEFLASAAFLAILTRALEKHAKVALRFDVPFDVESPVVQEVLANVSRRAWSVSDAFKRELAVVIAEAYRDGLTAAETANEIRALVGAESLTEAHARTIAETEIAALTNFAANRIATQLGLTYKTWMTRADGLVRDAHRAAHGQQVRIDQPFQVGGEALMYPGDIAGSLANTANCRCVPFFSNTLTAAATQEQEEVPVPYAIRKNAGGCGEDKPYAVVKTTDGEVMGCHATRSEAREQQKALYANESLTVNGLAPFAASDDGELDSVLWVSDIAFEGTATIDGRFILPEALTWRDLPLSLMAMTVNSGQGHVGSYVAGRIDHLSKDDKTDMNGEPLPEGVIALRGIGEFDVNGENGAEISRMVEDETLRGISVDLHADDVVFRDPETGEIHKIEDMDEDEIERAFWGELQVAFPEAVVLAATVCPTPAFDAARIALVAGADGERIVRVTSTFKILEPEEAAPIVAAATIQPPEHPPRDWFYTPEPPGLMPLTITDDGRVFGHLAGKDTCHTGFANSCVTPPETSTNYAMFHTGEVETAEGDLVPVGKIMYAGNKRGKHAPLHMSLVEASKHYDDNSHVGAHVRATRGDHGIWLSGALRPGIDAAGIAELRANAPSGDWRPYERGLELISAIAVPVQGFPIPRAEVSMVASADGADVRALVMSEGQFVPQECVVAALVAAGVLAESEAAGMTVEREIDRTEFEILAAEAEENPIEALALLAES